jgi:hypothetical protein
MLTKLAVAFGLMAICVAMHALGMTVVVGWARDRGFSHTAGVGRFSWGLIRVAGFTVLLHLAQIVTWAVAYTIGDAMPDFATAAYFSAVTYTTTGYGDWVLTPEWRLVGGVEALTGILMCGLSTGMFFAVFSGKLRPTSKQLLTKS